VGEIRDAETARIAFQAAQTGHLVLSTLHTNDAAATLTRLIDLGVEPYVVASSLHLVLAQRLVRRVCPKCAQPETADEELLQHFPALRAAAAGSVRRGRGCTACRQTGFDGRIGVYETLASLSHHRQSHRVGRRRERHPPARTAGRHAAPARGRPGEAA
jgi:general secretion pathway protein E